MFIDLGLFLYFAVLKAVRCANIDILDDRESTIMLAALEGSTTVMLTCPQRQHIDFTDVSLYNTGLWGKSCNIASDHWEKLEGRLSALIISIFNDAFMQ